MEPGQPMTPKPLDVFHEAARANSFWRFLGIEVEHAEEGRVRLRLLVRDEICNARGARVHGGVYPALIDAAVGGALLTVPVEGAETLGQATVDLNVSFLSAVTSGYLHVEGRVLRKGRTIGFGEAAITDDEGRVVAVGRATYAFPRRRSEQAP
jgi:acyl-CoA thioesterase